ncbi:MAG: aminotransferase class I/II-fold pyridoxal phosphate-dependent enzyme [Bacteroidota bacterium]
MDSITKNLANFMELPDRDLFAKAKPFYDFMNELSEKRFHHWHRVLSSPSEARVRIIDRYTGQERELINLASNNYLGLTTHPRVVEAGYEAYRKYGAGAGSVPLLGGTMSLHRELEQKLAATKGCEDAIIFTSGYSSNVGCVSGLVRKSDVAINDRLNHASIIDGCRLSGATFKTFRHNDPASLERTLAECDEEFQGKLVIVDGVYSMDGDIARLPEILPIVRKYGARLMIDEAHATGVIGAHGRGTPEHYGLEGQIDIVAGTLSKALGGVGGFVATTKEVVNYLRFYARSYMFSTALPPATTASLIAALDVIAEEPEIRARLWHNIRFVTDNLKKLGFDLGKAETAIIPIIVGDQTRLMPMSREVHEAGLFINPVYYPAVPKKQDRLRISLMATLSQDDLDYSLEVLEKVGKKYGVI